MPFSGLAPSKLKIFQQKLMVGYVYIEESFDNIFNMGYGGGLMPYASGNSPMLLRVNIMLIQLCPGTWRARSLMFLHHLTRKEQIFIQIFSVVYLLFKMGREHTMG